MKSAGGNGNEGERSCHPRRPESVRRGAVPELAATVRAPAIRDPSSCDCAGVLAAGGKRCERESALNWYGGGSVGARAVPQTASPSRTPTIRRPIGREGAGVRVPHAQGDKAEPTPAGSPLRGRVRIGVAGADAELARVVGAPTIDDTFEREAAAMAAPSTHDREGQRFGRAGGFPARLEPRRDETRSNRREPKACRHRHPPISDRKS